MSRSREDLFRPYTSYRSHTPEIKDASTFPLRSRRGGGSHNLSPDGKAAREMDVGKGFETERPEQVARHFVYVLNKKLKPKRFSCRKLENGKFLILRTA